MTAQPAVGTSAVETHVRTAMSPQVLTVGPAHSLREVSRAMATRKVGAAVVVDPDGAGAGIITERDVLHALAEGADPDVETVGGHLTPDIVYAAPTWTLDEAADAMLRHGFRHLVVLDAGDVAGILSVRDVLRAYREADGPPAPVEPSPLGAD